MNDPEVAKAMQVRQRIQRRKDEDTQVAQVGDGDGEDEDEDVVPRPVELTPAPRGAQPPPP